MEELSYVLTKNVVACVPLRFYFFHCRSFFTLLASSISHFSHRRYEIFMCFFQRNSSSSFLITRSSSFSAIHVSVDIKNNVEKDSILTRLCCCFFFSLKVGYPKSPGGHAISRQKHLVIPVVSYLLWCHTCYFTSGMPVVRTAGRTGRTVT